MDHHLLLRAAARAICDACYPSDNRSPVGFDEAERCGTAYYRQVVDAALQARAVLAVRGEQLPLPALA